MHKYIRIHKYESKYTTHHGWLLPDYLPRTSRSPSCKASGRSSNMVSTYTSTIPTRGRVAHVNRDRRHPGVAPNLLPDQ